MPGLSPVPSPEHLSRAPSPSPRSPGAVGTSPAARLGATAPLQHSSTIDPPFANKQLPLWALIKMDRGLFKCPPFPAARAGCTLLSNQWCGEELDRYLLHSCDTDRHQPESAQCQQGLRAPHQTCSLAKKCARVPAKPLRRCKGIGRKRREEERGMQEVGMQEVHG